MFEKFFDFTLSSSHKINLSRRRTALTRNMARAFTPLALGLAAFSLAGQAARADTVTFEDLSTSSAVNPYGNSVSDGGLTLSTQGSAYIVNGSLLPSGNGANNGTQFYIGSSADTASNGNGYFNTITATSGQAFSVQSLDLGASIDLPTPQTAVLTGNLASGGTVTDTVSLTQSFQTLALNFDDITSLVIDTPGSNPFGYISIDNIVYEPVSTTPVPGSLSLALTGGAMLLGLIAAKRRRTDAAPQLL